MALVIKDRVKQTTTTTGTGTLTLNGTIDGFQTFAAALSDGDTTYYALLEPSTNNWEVGLGTWTEGSSLLARTTVLASSNSGSAVNLTAQAEVFISQPAGKAAFFNADGDLDLSRDPQTALQAATKQYVDTIAAAGIHYHTPVRVEAPSNLNATYNNGTAGVGATLTNAGTQAAITIDGVALSSADRVLIYNQTNAAHNGIYTVTTVGDGSTNWVLTRATDADSYGASDPDSLGEGDAFFVKEGDTGAGELYVMNTSGTITFGTTNITFTVIAETAVYSAGNGVTLTGTVFAADAGTGVTVDGSGINIGQAVETTSDVTFNSVAASLTGSVTGNVTGDVTGNADTATALETARNIGGVSFDGTASINLPGVNTAGNQDTSGNAATATAWATGRTISLTGDVTGSVTGVDGSGNASIATTIAADSVALGTDTTGDYVSTVTSGNYLTGGTTGEGSTPTLNVDATPNNTASKVVARDASGNFSAGTITASLSGNATTASSLATGRSIALSGDVSGSTTFDGSGNVTITTTIADDSHNHVISNVDGLQSALDGKQASGTYNTVIGTDSDIDTSGSTIVDNIYVTDGVITSMGTRTLTLGDLGYTGATNANYITNNNQLTNGAGYTTYSANQSLNTNNSPTFSDVYANSWFRNNASGKGLYNTATGQHWYSDDDDYWNIAGGGAANGIRFRDDHNSTIRGYVYADNTNAIGFLDSDSQWAIKHTRDSRTEFYINNAERMELNNEGLFLHDGSLAEDYDALSGTSPTCNVDNGGAFSLTMSGNTTFTFSGAGNNWSQGFILQLTGNGSTVTWPSTVRWAGGTAPDAPASGETDVLVFHTRDGGSNWYGVLASDAAA
jgi:hypothetical protein